MTTHPAPTAYFTADDGAVVGYQVDPEIIEDTMFRRGIRRSVLADKISKSRPYVTRILSGQRQPSWDVVRAIADVLDVHPRALLLRTVSGNSGTTDPEQEPAGAAVSA